MDCRLQARVKEMVEELGIREHQQELAAAGTLVDLEELTCQYWRRVHPAVNRARSWARRGETHRQRPADCPDCGRHCLPDYEPEPTLLIRLARRVGALCNPSISATAVGGLFFPLAARLGLPPH